MNPLLMSDSYKYSHHNQYPPEAGNLSFYIMARTDFKAIMFFGLQHILKSILCRQVTRHDIDEAEDLLGKHIPGIFKRKVWEPLITQHDGAWPIQIQAIPEGMVVPGNNVLMTIQGTDPNMPWVPAFLEDILLQSWYTCSVATQSLILRMVLEDRLKETGHDSVDFKLHDFGVRACSSMEHAARGGAAHLVSFKGTDNVPALRLLRDSYHEPCAGFSIPAMEHSTVTTWLRNREAEAYENMLIKYGGEGKIIACVSDSYNIDHAVEHIWGEQLRQKVIDSGTTVVIRPDSGDPRETVMKTLLTLEQKFGTQTNSKGFKVLNNVRVIQGDGVNIESIVDISDDLITAGFSMDNIAFGMGSALLQEHLRDELGFAMKCSALHNGEEWVGVSKSPINAPEKTSLEGVLTLIHENGKFKTVDKRKEASLWREKGMGNVMEMVFLNGYLMRDELFSDIRDRALNYISTLQQQP